MYVYKSQGALHNSNIHLFVCLSPVCCPKADSAATEPLRCKGVTDVSFFSCENFTPHEIYVSGGG